jgi:ribosomal protein S18 acetylase RimI-like enzyme
MLTKQTVNYTIRDATENDRAACLQLDISYETEYAWQMDVRDEDGAIVVGLRTVRLPRLMRVAYPRDAAAFTLDEQNRFLVAETSGVLCGYLIMRFDTSRSTGWITDIALGRHWRRQKIGCGLLHEAYLRAQQHQLRRLTVETQTKNSPGICFCLKNGLTFCGFNDRYYPNHDIALFFGQNVQLET